MELRDLRIADQTRKLIDYEKALCITDFDIENIYRDAKDFVYIYNSRHREDPPETLLSAAKVHAFGVLHLLYQVVATTYDDAQGGTFFQSLRQEAAASESTMEMLRFYDRQFPSILPDEQKHISNSSAEDARGLFLHRVFLENPALKVSAAPLISPAGLTFPSGLTGFTQLAQTVSSRSGTVEGSNKDLFTFLTTPAKEHPESLTEQISFIMVHWGTLIPQELKKGLLHVLDVIREEEKIRFSGGPGPAIVQDYQYLEHEYEAFSSDWDWMPNVVMMAKSTLVWLDQLSRSYGRTIDTLDKIPDRELDLLSERGFNALWLIGIWERSEASKKIKHYCGNPEAEASAYSLKSYNIDQKIGGWQAYHNLNERCHERHIRLASDMVPNHTGIDSEWALHHPEYFVRSPYSPFPSYTFNGADLSPDDRIEVKIDDHYYDRTDAAVAYRRVNRETSETTYIFHGNDGTSMPWNDTAQLDFLNPNTREAVIQQILHVARNFHIIRFDAAMTLAKRHIQRLWYPRPGSGGDIPGRAGYALSDEEFNNAIPMEFWREVVDRIALEVPDTLLLAEAFWMMEGYFVRTLGMHRVYNSAFMNMLKNQANKEYRDTIKNTLSFDPEVLKRFVNFMNNPDEDTAIAQFGDGDKYFGVATLLSTMPGLPMYGHGQLEGFHEKYGMEYSKAYWNEFPNEHLIREHERRIFPLLRLRYLFSGSEHFEIFDAVDNGHISESIFAYVNGVEETKTLVLYNNQYEHAGGKIYQSSPKLEKKDEGERELRTVSFAQALGLTFADDTFVLYESFPEKMSYIARSKDLYDHGFWVSLNGYETQVLLHIREVKDLDGSYAQLFSHLDGKGTRSMERDIAWIRMRNLHHSLENFAKEEMLEYIRQTAAQKEMGSRDIRKYVLLIGESYARFATTYEQMSERSKESIPPLVREMQPRDMLLTIQNLTAAFSEETDHPFLPVGGVLLSELPMLINASLIMSLFIDRESSYEQAIDIADSLVLERLFAPLSTMLGIDVDYRLRNLLLLATALVTIPRCLRNHLEQEETDARRMLSDLLSDTGFRTLIHQNEHQGVTYYRKESFQEMVYLITLGVAMEKGDYYNRKMTKAAQAWLRADALSEYRIERLLEGIQ